jgi:glutathione S-transferase
MRRKVPETIGACFEMIEARMLKGPWVIGETYSIADSYLCTIAQWLAGVGGDPNRFPRLIEHRESMSERPAVRKAIAMELAD